MTQTMTGAIALDRTEHRPCPLAAEFAEQVYRRMDDRGAAVVLFGSRGRGDHGEDSDTDIIIHLPVGLSGTEWKRAARRIDELLEGTHSRERHLLGGLDWTFSTSWDHPVWREPGDRPWHGPADGLIFAEADIAGEIPAQLQGEASPGGTRFHFLAEGMRGASYWTPPHGGGRLILPCRYDRLGSPRCKEE